MAPARLLNAMNLLVEEHLLQQPDQVLCCSFLQQELDEDVISELDMQDRNFGIGGGGGGEGAAAWPRWRERSYDEQSSGSSALPQLCQLQLLELRHLSGGGGDGAAAWPRWSARTTSSHQD
jgi:hypothetical protein